MSQSSDRLFFEQIQSFPVFGFQRWREKPMKRVYNFSAGPAVLPEEVLREAADEMLDYNGTGMSVMEMSHRSKAF